MFRDENESGSKGRYCQETKYRYNLLQFNCSYSNFVDCDNLEAGADTNEAEFLTSHPLNVSLTRDYANPSVTLRLLQRGAHVPQECPPQNAEDSLVSLATQESSIDVIRELIVRGSPVNCQFRGETALYWAALNGQYDRVELLLDSGADPHQLDLDASSTTNPDSRVQGDFAKTRQLLKEALKQLNRR